MAVPSAITDLTVDESTNFPPDTETVTATTRPSDYLRAHAAILRREQAQGAAVASAATVDLGAIADGNYVHITGAVTITAFGTVAAGISRTVVFDAALTLTHNATSLILPGGANITTAAGDVAVFRSEGSGNWRCVSYLKASGTYQPLDSELTAIAGLTSAANKVPRFTGSGTAELIDVDYGTYTPTLTTGTNAEALVVLGAWYYSRIGNIVTVSGRFTYDPLNPTVNVTWYATLPIASDFTLSTDAAGSVADMQRGSGTVYADEINNRLIFYVENGDYASVTTAGFTAQYIVK